MWETIGAEKRGSFYDAVGALRDVGQNHLLQMLALATMDKPSDWNAEAIRDKRADFLETLQPLSESEIIADSYRSQYIGFKEIIGVNEESKTETLF